MDDERYGSRRAGEHAWTHGESEGKKLPETPRREMVHPPEKDAARMEDLETIKALREKVATLEEAEIEIKMLRQQINDAPDDTLPALTGERIKRLREVQQRVGEDDVTEKLAEYGKKLERAEARYKTTFPDFPLPNPSSEGQEIRN